MLVKVVLEDKNVAAMVEAARSFVEGLSPFHAENG